MANINFDKIIWSGNETSKAYHINQEIWRGGGLIAGDSSHGFYGEVPASEFITGDALATAIGLTAGIAQNSDVGWLKFALDGKILYVAKKTLRHTISWDSINAVGAVYGTKTVNISGTTHKVRLLKGATSDPATAETGTAVHGSEWNKLMLPIHIKSSTGTWLYPANVEANLPDWGVGYTDTDILTNREDGSKGSYSWTQNRINVSQYGAQALTKGLNDASYSISVNTTRMVDADGWRPCLEEV